MTITLKKIQEMAAGSDADALQCMLVLWKFNKPTYEEWVLLVEKVISFEASQFSTRRHNLQNLSEDALTSILVISLNSISLQASSAVVNGNCDLTVSYSDYLWIAEAKIFTGVRVVWHGYQQLTSRYATGMPNQNRGAMLLYCFKDSASSLLAEWREVLKLEIQNVNDRDGELALTFRSSDVCRSTGLELDILHYAFPLLHEPQEDVRKLGKESFAAGKRAKEQAKSRAA